MSTTHPSARPFLLGVTGGIGAGKSRACRILEACGADVFYADDEAKRLLLRDDARADVVAAFGADTYRSDGSLDRARLGALVFADPDALARLNAIVHPRVRDAFAERVALSSAPMLVKEAAILFESGGDAELDATLVVDAPVDVRIARTMARDGVDRASVEARIARQMSDEERRARADYVLVNEGEGDAFDAEVRALYRRLVGGGVEQGRRA
jgi:dephospho-CoA kinase